MLLVSFVLIFTEAVLRVVTLALPTSIINIFYRGSRRLFNALSSPQSRKSRNKKKGVSTAVAQAADFVEICEVFGYYAEEHIVHTKDGYLLGLHRLAWRQGEEAERVNSGPGSIQKKVIYLHHGLLMNSEVWVCLTERERCLPFLLVERGYDVWVCISRSIHCNEHSSDNECSLVTIEATNTRRSLRSTRRLSPNFGPSQLTSSRSTIFQTASSTSFQPRSNRRSHTSDSPKALLKHLRLFLSTLFSTKRLTFS